jgi:hypothetical protein
MADTQLSLACSDAGSVVSAVSFASYGTPAGACGSWAVGACNAANSTAVVEAACLGKPVIARRQLEFARLSGGGLGRVLSHASLQRPMGLL